MSSNDLIIHTGYVSQNTFLPKPIGHNTALLEHLPYIMEISLADSRSSMFSDERHISRKVIVL